MGFDPNPTFVAALLSNPTLSRVTARDRHRNRISCRAQLADHIKWLKRLEALQRPLTLWNEAESSRTTESAAADILSYAFSPIVTGILLSGITAFLVHLTGAVDAIKHFAASQPSNEVARVARFRGLPMVEEEMKEKMKDMEAGMDSFIESVSPEDATLSKEEIAKQQALIREVWETINTSYYNERDPTFSKDRWARLRDEALKQKPKSKSSAYRIIRNMIAKGLKDPYAKLISADEFRTMQKYDMTGVGLNVGSSEEFYQKVSSKIPGGKKTSGDGIWVMGLLKGSASEQAGIQQGDQILEIDGVPVNGSSSYEAAQMIKGDASQSKVTLKIRRKEGSPQEINMERGVHQITPTVKTTTERIRFRKVGRIKVSGCNSEARQEILHGLEALQGKNVKEVILDLRGNPGGLVEEAAEIAKLFLDEGSTVYVKRDGGDGHESRVISRQAPSTRMRLTVQVDEKTASAAEIIAGAMQDNCRGVIAGDRTYGKGLIQSVFQLSDGSGLTLTVGKYYTPDMTDIDQSGIIPDFKKIPPSNRAEETLNACRLRRVARR